MGSKGDYIQSRICNHHPETCTCQDEDVKQVTPPREVVVIDRTTLDNLIAKYKNPEDDFQRGVRSALRNLTRTFPILRIDQTIEERAANLIEKFKPNLWSCGDTRGEENENELRNAKACVEITIEFALQQQIIEGMKGKEKCEHEPDSLKGIYTHCTKCGIILQIKK